MSVTHHAQAPWSVGGGDSGGWSASHDGFGVSEYTSILDAAGTVVALAVAHSSDHYTRDLDTPSLARLIAAAPELLEAIMLYESAWKNSTSSRDESRRMILASDAADKAIAKATGSAS